MNRLANWMMRLYPARWRARYGDELQALLADTGADARVVTDLLKGGMRMQFMTWSFPKLAATLGILGVLLGIGVGLMLPNEYTSRATMEIQPAQISDSVVQSTIRNSLNKRIQQMTTQVMSRTSLAQIIQDPQNDLYKDERKTQPLEDVIEKMKGAIMIQFVALPGALGRRASAFNILFSYNDRHKAQQTVRALMNKFDEVNQSQQRTAAVNNDQLLVLESASFPATPSPAQKGTAAVYRSQATIALPKGAGADRITALQALAFSRTSLSGVINNPQLLLYRDQLRTQRLEDVIQTMQQHLVVTPIHFRDLVFFDVSFDYDDPHKAQQAVSMIVNAFSEAESRMFPDIGVPPPGFPRGEILDVLDTASLPVQPTKPKRSFITMLGGVCGLTTAAIIALIRRRWKPAADIPVDAVPE